MRVLLSTGGGGGGGGGIFKPFFFLLLGYDPMEPSGEQSSTSIGQNVQQ